MNRMGKMKREVGFTGRKHRNNWFDYLNYTLMILMVIITIYPLVYVLAGSFNEGIDYVRGGIYFFPRVFTTDNYVVVLNDPRLWRGYFITVSRTVIGTTSALLFTSMVAYAMSRKDLFFRRFFYWVSIFTMFFGGGLIPFFLVINMIGLYNTFWVYIIPGLYSVFNMLVFISFFRTIPEDLHEAAIMDGASEFKIYRMIILPLSKPVLSIIGLWIAVGHWNAFLDAMIFTVDENLQTLQYYLMKVVRESTMPAEGVPLPPEILNTISPETVTLAAIIVSVLPVMIFYPFIHRLATQGVVIGSLKG